MRFRYLCCTQSLRWANHLGISVERKKAIGVVGIVGKNAQCWRGRVLERRALWSVENYAMIGEVCFSAVQVPLLYAKSTFNLSK